MTELFNKHSEKAKRRLLRKQQTEAENLLWSELRNRKLNGFKFRRQVSIYNYVVDFFCPEYNLVIELDGGIHSRPDIAENDVFRQTTIENVGITFLRFKNEELEINMEKVLRAIIQKIKVLESTPLLAKERGRGEVI